MKCASCGKRLDKKGFLCQRCTSRQNERRIKTQKKINERLRKARERLEEIIFNRPPPRRVP